jgi:hypothetical protein
MFVGGLMNATISNFGHIPYGKTIVGFYFDSFYFSKPQPIMMLRTHMPANHLARSPLTSTLKDMMSLKPKPLFSLSEGWFRHLNYQRKLHLCQESKKRHESGRKNDCHY